MCLIETQLTAGEVLRAFHHDEPYLFLGAAFTTVAIVSAAFCILRRRFDALIVYLAIFAFLYGQRLWLGAEVLRISLPGSEFFLRLRVAVNYLVPIPAFFFFQAAGILGRRSKIVISVLTVIFLGLVAGTFIFGALQAFDTASSILVIAALPGIGLRSLLRATRGQLDSAALRIGLSCFVAGALWDNLLREFWKLPRVEPYCFAILLGSLGYIAARHTMRRDHELDEMHNELELARRIQLSILPAEFPPSAHFQVAARYIPMTAVAGDFYDFLHVDETQAGILIADVSGHGMPAALIASMVKMAAISQRANAREPAALLTEVNASLCGNTQSQFITAAYVHLDATAGQLHYAAAGHPPMLLLRNGQVTEIIENGLILAVTPSATFTQRTLPLERGDRLVLYTDGIIEARNQQGRLFGEENLFAVACHTASLIPAEAADRIVATVEQWSKSQDDDLTIIVCDFCLAS